MEPLFRFTGVRCKGLDRAYTFTLHTGELRLMQFSSREEKGAVIDCAIGETVCAEGAIEIVQGERRRNREAIKPSEEKRKRDNADASLQWQPLGASRQDRVAWVAGNGSLISNLRIWENVTLPLWYHDRRDAAETEQSVTRWLGVLGLEQEAFAEFMAAQPYRIEPRQRKLAGLLRALLQMPDVLVVDAMLFEDVPDRLASCWIAALESYAAEGHAVLAMTDKATMLSWGKISGENIE